MFMIYNFMDFSLQTSSSLVHSPFCVVGPHGHVPRLCYTVKVDPRRTQLVLSNTASQSMLNWDVQFKSIILV